jgi:hypothetical protein
MTVGAPGSAVSAALLLMCAVLVLAGPTRAAQPVAEPVVQFLQVDAAFAGRTPQFLGDGLPVRVPRPGRPGWAQRSGRLLRAGHDMTIRRPATADDVLPRTRSLPGGAPLDLLGGPAGSLEQAARPVAEPRLRVRMRLRARTGVLRRAASDSQQRGERQDREPHLA